MMTFTMKLKDKDLKEIDDDIEHWFGIKLTRTQLSKFLRKHPRLVAEIISMGFDTGARESFIEYLSEDLTGRMWPIIGDSIKIKRQFFKTFTKATKEAGIHYDPADAN